MVDRDTLTTKQRETYDLWVLVGKDPNDPELESLLGEVKKPLSKVRHEKNEQKEAITQEAEAVLLHLRKIDTLMQKLCPECGRYFATNYHYAGHCSDNCIETSLAKVGIKWDRNAKSAQERWNGPDVNGEVPAIVEPGTLVFLKRWARMVLEWEDTNNGRKEENEHLGDGSRLHAGGLEPIRLKVLTHTFTASDPTLRPLDPPIYFDDPFADI